MIEKKNIDRLFQEKFKDFEAIPSEKVWENIEAELKEKKKRRVIPFWFRFAGAAAVLVLGGLLLYKLAFSGNGIEGRVVNGGKNQIENNVVPNNSSPLESPSLENRLVEKDNGKAVASENADGNNPRRSDVNENDPANNSNGTISPSENPSQINNTNKPSNIKSSSAVAGSDATPIKNQSGKATNRKDLRLVKEGLENRGTQKAVIGSHKKNKKASGRNNPVVEKPEQAVVAQSDNRTNIKGEQPVQNKSVEKENTSQQQTNNQLANQSDKKPLEDNKNQEKPANAGMTDKITTGIAENTDIKKDSAGVATAQPNALEELLNEKENNVTAKEQKVNRWQITSNVAPIYFSSTSNGSPLDSRFQDNKKTYAPSVSYGIGAKYALSKKFFIKSGVNSVSLEYNTSDVIFFQTENARKIENVSPNLKGSLIQVDNIPVSGLATLDRSIRQFSGDLNQKISYVEIPVEMSYQLVNRKFGVELIGGLSTLILNQNQVSLVSSGVDMNIGEADNLNNLHFSTNVGVGFKYTFLKKFEANFEPMFKYQINTFSDNAGNFKPYFFGLYSGVSYRF